MIQEYPTQIQPRSSSTREIKKQENSNKIEAEASRILIDLANQDTPSHYDNTLSIENKYKRKNSTSQQQKVSLPIKTDANYHLFEEHVQPDPIMLLAAAAAVIDDEGKYKGRLYQRREIKLHGRHGTLKRKSFTFGSNEETEGYQHLTRRHSERNSTKQVQKESTESWIKTNPIPPIEEDKKIKNESQSEGTHTFSWQYLSMKQNPRIKRNAMHAYITYMIYTDRVHQEQQKRMREQNNNNYTIHNSNTRYNHDWYNNSNNMQSYRLPPSPRQRHESESIIGRPLTDYLFNSNNNNLLPPPSNRY